MKAPAPRPIRTDSGDFATADEPLWTPEDVIAFLRLDSVHQVYELCRRSSSGGKGKRRLDRQHPLPSFKIGKYLRFDRAAVIAWVKAARIERRSPAA